MRKRPDSDQFEIDQSSGQPGFGAFLSASHRWLPALLVSLLFGYLAVTTFEKKPVFESVAQRQEYYGKLGLTENEPMPVVLVTSWCPACRNLEKQLHAEGVKFLRADIEENKVAGELFERCRRAGYSNTIPKVLLGDQVVPNSAKAIKNLLAQSRG
jgi:glutaredoxin